MRLGLLLVGAVVAVPAIATADAPRRSLASWDAAGTASLNDIIVSAERPDGYQTARQLVAPAAPTGTALQGGPAGVLAQSRLVYLNRGGVTLQPGVNDSRTNKSAIATQATTVASWNPTPVTWSATVSCLKEIFSPFDITFTETDPGNVPHIEAVFGGSPAQFGMASSIAGVSPFTTSCDIIENSIVFTFTNVLPPDDPITACEIQAQEIAHSYGLDHVLLASDPMTYLPFNGRRWFRNMDTSCGEDTARPCGLNGSVCRRAQNSVTMLMERVGLKSQAGDTVAPTVEITSPSAGATVPPSFDVSFRAADNAKVTMVSLYVDGVPSGSVVLAPYTIKVPGNLTEGTHKIRIAATDGKNDKSQEITVTVRRGAAAPGGDGDVTGGCAAGGGGSAGAGIWFALAALVGAVLRRRRRR